jgi:large subunit ribosomal protein L10
MIGEIIGLLQSPIQRLISALEKKKKLKELLRTEVEAPATEETPEAPEAEGEACCRITKIVCRKKRVKTLKKII